MFNEQCSSSGGRLELCVNRNLWDGQFMGPDVIRLLKGLAVSDQHNKLIKEMRPALTSWITLLQSVTWVFNAITELRLNNCNLTVTTIGVYYGRSLSRHYLGHCLYQQTYLIVDLTNNLNKGRPRLRVQSKLCKWSPIKRTLSDHRLCIGQRLVKRECDIHCMVDGVTLPQCRNCLQSPDQFPEETDILTASESAFERPPFNSTRSHKLSIAPFTISVRILNNNCSGNRLCVYSNGFLCSKRL